MIDRTNSFIVLKEQIQDSFDFVVLNCQAIPALKGYIKAVNNRSVSKLPDPDHFGSPIDTQRLPEIIPKYRKTLGRFLILSSFSYFETYISNVFQEVFAFHGGEEAFIEMAKSKRLQSFQATDTPQINAYIRKLQEVPKQSQKEKYTKYNGMLSTTTYKFPTSLFSVYGIVQAQRQIKDLRSVEIPDVLEIALGIDLSQTEIDNFHRIRNLRNNIAHGKQDEVDLRAAISDNRYLKELAKKVDKHIIKYFLIVEY